MKKYIFILFLSIFYIHNINSQCQNDFQWPQSIVAAPTDFDTAIIHNVSIAGDYAETNEFVSGETYIFTSDSINDFITLRSFDQSTVLAFGTQPLEYTVEEDTAMTVHFNTQGCGFSAIARTTKIIHKLIIETNNIGINVETPEATLDINGKLKVADDENTAVTGMIRYNEDTQDFEGYDGEKWRSFTKPSAIWGETLAPVAKSNSTFIATDGGEFDYYGVNIDIDGEWIVISATVQDIDGNSSQGSVYVYKRQNNEIIFHQKLVSPNGMAFDMFGSGDIDVNNPYLIIGSPNTNHESSVGTAEIWELKNDVWSWKESIGNGNDDFTFHFAGSVAIGVNYAAIQNADQIQGIDEVHIYKKIGFDWIQTDVIVNDLNSGFFAASMEWLDGQLYIGDPDAFGDGYVGGRLLIYDMDGNDDAVLSQTINNPGENDNFGDLFGRRMDLHGNKMIIGSPGYLVDGLFRSGSVYIYSRADVDSDWELQQTIQENPATEFSDFGTQVSIYEDQALVSITGFQDLPAKTYVYKQENNTWSLEAILMDGNETNDDFFGLGAEIDDNLIMIGASRTDTNGNQDQGKVYIFCK